MNYEKLNKRLEYMLEHETDDFFTNIILKNEVANKLFDYQLLHVFNLLTIFRSEKCALDYSDTGVGKSYTSIAIAKQLDLLPFIICPKTMLTKWKDVCDFFNIKPLGIVNYECIKMGKYYNKLGDRVDCNFIEVSGHDPKNIQFKWKLPKNCLVIVDEAHNCKNAKSQNGKLLLSLKNNNHKVLMLSATLVDKPDSFHVFGYMLGFYKDIKKARPWINGMIQEDKMYIGSKIKLSAINNAIYPNKGSRIRISELGDKFPQNQISVDNYFIEKDKRDIVNKAFLNIKKHDKIIKNDINDENMNVLVEINKSRMLIEEYKVPVMVDLINDYIDNGKSVVVFVNFKETIKNLSKIFKTSCIVSGDESLEQRMENIRRFQDNETNLIICNIAISEGFDLHDLHGVQRVSLISMSFSSTHLIQSLGRIWRAGSKTPCLQLIICLADTLEEIICKNLKNKLNFLSQLNDNDLINIDN